MEKLNEKKAEHADWSPNGLDGNSGSSTSHDAVFHMSGHRGYFLWLACCATQYRLYSQVKQSDVSVYFVWNILKKKRVYL